MLSPLAAEISPSGRGALFYLFVFVVGGCAAHGGLEKTGNAHRCRRQQRQATTQWGEEKAGTRVQWTANSKINPCTCIRLNLEVVDTDVLRIAGLPPGSGEAPVFSNCQRKQTKGP